MKSLITSGLLLLMAAGTHSFAGTQKAGEATWVTDKEGNKTLTCPWKDNTACYTINNDGTITIYEKTRCLQGFLLDEGGSGTPDDPWTAVVSDVHEVDCSDLPQD